MTYKIIGKYIKELKFNISNPKTFFLLAKDITNYKINIDIKSVQVKQNIIEVLTSLKLTPSKIYPELRRIFIFLFENSGFKDIKINETVDFEKLYKIRKVQ